MLKTINLRRLALVVSVFSIMTSITQAQVCAGGYARDQRAIVLNLEGGPTDTLKRMAELALYAANGTVSSVMRLAYYEEFKAHRDNLDVYDSYLGPEATERTIQFIDTVVDAEYLALSKVTLLGESTDDAIANSRNALISVTRALEQVRFCFHNSYDQIAIQGTPNDRRCAGGFVEEEWRFPTKRFIPLRDILLKLVEAVAESIGPFSVIDRKIKQADIDFLKGEIMLANMGFPRASQRTNNFIRRVYNPVYLGIAQITVDGTTAEEAFQNVRRARKSAQEAIEISEKCLFEQGRVRTGQRFVN